MIQTLITVFSKLRYTALALVVAFFVFALAVWLPNIELIIRILSGSVALSEKILFLWTMLGAIETNFTIVSATYTVLIALLFGVTISLLTFFINRRRIGGVRGEVSVGVGGLVSGIFGIGCAACGTFILSSLLGLVGAGGLVTLLPFGGEEFGFLAVGLLLYTVYALLKKINEPFVCEIE